MKQKFFGMVMSAGGMPEQLPIGNPALIPTDDCTDAEIDRLKAAFETLLALPHKQIKVGRCGPVPLPEIIDLHLVHCAHHLSFLEPSVAGPMLQQPTKYRKLVFADIHAAVAEIDRLNGSPTEQLGNWSLAQICQHLVATFRQPFTAPADVNSTAEQAKARDQILGTLIATGRPPAGVAPPVELMPHTDAGPADIEAAKQGLIALADFPHSHIDRGRFGPVPIEMYRKVVLIHVAHHLGFLLPVSSRRNLNYNSIDDLIADVKQLRKGYTQVGNWNLPQMCRHLTVSLSNTMRPSTEPATPEQLKVRHLLENGLTTGKLPSGLQAPERSLPPTDCNDADIDAMIATFDRARTYNAPQSNHPRFGPLTLAEFNRMILVHAAHHLSYLVPATDH